MAATGRPPLMRLSLSDTAALREETAAIDPGAELFLFGSRADDTARGGDIDVLIVSDRIGFADTLRLRARVLDRIGWQQLDLIVRRRGQLDDPIAALAFATGIRL